MDATSGASAAATRRTVVAVAGAGGLTAVLAACGGSNSGSPGPGGSTNDGGSDPGGRASAPSGTGKGTPLAKASEIPEGGGKIFAGQKVVVTQPSADEFKAFSAICTHQGCTVSEVKDGTIHCPCHGSRFRITDGSVAQGPAVQPLAAMKVTVVGGEVTLD